MNIIPQIAFEKLKLKKACNLIGGEDFGLQLENQIWSSQTWSFHKMIWPIMGHQLKHKSNAALAKMLNLLLLVQICLVYLIT